MVRMKVLVTQYVKNIIGKLLFENDVIAENF